MCNVCITSRTHTHVHINTHCSNLRELQSRITSIKLIILLVNQRNILIMFLFIFIIYFMYNTTHPRLAASSVWLGFPSTLWVSSYNFKTAASVPTLRCSDLPLPCWNQPQSTDHLSTNPFNNSCLFDQTTDKLLSLLLR